MNRTLVTLSLFVNYFVFAILLNSVGTVILQVQNTYGVSESAAGVLEAFKDLPIAITSFLIASFIARLGYRPAMQIALLLVAAAALAMPSLPGFWMAKVMFAATGVGFALVKISVFATIGVVTDSRKAHAGMMNFLESFFMVGVLSGYFLFSAFVDDARPESIAWLNVYYVLAGMAGLAFILLSAARIETPAPEESGKPLRQEFVDMLRLVALPLVMVFVVSAFLYVLIEQSIMSWLPTFNSRILNLSPSLSIEMASILAAATALGRFVAGFVLQRFDWSRVLLGSLVCAAALVLVALPLAGGASAQPIATWSAAPLAAFVFPLIGFLLAPVYPAINSVILSSLPKRRHAAMAGLIVVFSALGGTSGSMLTGALFEVFGGKTAFYFSLLPIALMFVAVLAFKRLSEQTHPAESAS
ncbi:MAG: MFS transporter [Pseudomonadota bacterium]